MRIVSGGQTGVDRAALEAALELELPCGGWCPAGRWAEDGPIAMRYPLVETPSPNPAQRTFWNVRDSDGTLILVRGEVRRGTAFTIEAARRLRRPYLLVDLGSPRDPRKPGRWIEALGIRTLNVAGPRESEAPGIYRQAVRFLHPVLRAVRRQRRTMACGF